MASVGGGGEPMRAERAYSQAAIDEDGAAITARATRPTGGAMEKGTWTGVHSQERKRCSV